MDKHIPSVIRSCSMVEVIRVTFVRGCGSSMNDVVREVEAFYRPDGSLIVELDPERARLTPDRASDPAARPSS